MIQLKDWKVTMTYGESQLGYQADHLAKRLEIQSDLEPAWSVKLDLRLGGAANVIDLIHDGSLLYVDLTREMLWRDGFYECQLRGICENVVRHSNCFRLSVRDSINAIDAFAPLQPSEMAQLEARLTGLSQDAQTAATQAAESAEQAKNAEVFAISAGESAKSAEADRQASETAAELTQKIVAEAATKADYAALILRLEAVETATVDAINASY